MKGLAKNGNLPGVCLQQSEQGAKGCCFSGAIRTEKTINAILGNAEIKVMQNFFGRRKAIVKLIGFDNEFMHACKTMEQLGLLPLSNTNYDQQGS